MTFRKYNSIENSYRDKTINLIKTMGLGSANVEWVVTEKVHGANFQISYDGETVTFSSRNGALSDDDSFYGYKRIAETLTDGIKALYDQTQGVDVRVYGELFGGGYDHPDVEQCSCKQVQRGVQYSPKTEFYAFDLMVKSGEYESYVLWTEAEDLLSEHFFTAKTLFKGTLDECLAYTNEYQTTIPDLLGYPEIGDNTCEGNVIKPVLSDYFESGSRVILKNKNDKFSENDKVVKLKIPLSELAEALIDTVSSYVNENRYEAVVSKLPEIDYTDKKNIGKLMGLMVGDTMSDFAKDYEQLDLLNKVEKKAVSNRVMELSRNIVLEKF